MLPVVQTRDDEFHRRPSYTTNANEPIRRVSIASQSPPNPLRRVLLATARVVVDLRRSSIDVSATMESQRQAPPGYAYSHHPDNLKLPSVPQQELHMNHAPADITLPDLKSVLADLPPKTGHPNAFSNAVAAREMDQMGMPRTSIESDAASNMSLDDGTQRSTSVSMDDPDVRLAAEALSGLGNPGVYAQSPHELRHRLIFQTLRVHPRIGHRPQSPALHAPLHLQTRTLSRCWTFWSMPIRGSETQ